MKLLLATGLFFTCYLILSRSVYRFIAPEEVTRDGYAHLALIRDIQNHNHRYPDRPSGLATGGFYSYPFLMHWILSFVPQTNLKKIDRYFSGIMDALFACLFYAQYSLGLLNFNETLLALGLFAVTPEFFRADQAHGRGISGRKPGVFLTTASILSAVLWIEKGPIEFLIASIVVGSFVALTSKFGLQALTFISIGVGILLNPVVIILPVASIIVAYLISLGEYGHIFRTHVRHSYNYAKKFGIYNPRENAPGGDSKSFINRFKAIFDRNISKSELWSIRNLQSVRLVINYPLILLLLSATVYALFGVSIPQIRLEFWAWVTTGVTTFILVSTPPLQFLGEAERYLEYTFFPASIVCAQLVGKLPTEFTILFGCVIVMGLGAQVLYPVLYSKFMITDQDRREDIEELVTFISNSDYGVGIIQPTNEARLLSWNTSKKYVDMGLNSSSTPAVVAEKDKLHQDGAPYVTDDVDWLAKQYEPDFVIFDRQRTPCPGLSIPEQNPIFENTSFIVFKFQQVREQM
jgi:hypothetical protein